MYINEFKIAEELAAMGTLAGAVLMRIRAFVLRGVTSFSSLFSIPSCSCLLR